MKSSSGVAHQDTPLPQDPCTKLLSTTTVGGGFASGFQSSGGERPLERVSTFHSSLASVVPNINNYRTFITSTQWVVVYLYKLDRTENVILSLNTITIIFPSEQSTRSFNLVVVVIYLPLQRSFQFLPAEKPGDLLAEMSISSPV